MSCLTPSVPLILLFHSISNSLLVLITLGHRMIVIATNVAETSITIPGIRYVHWYIRTLTHTYIDTYVHWYIRTMVQHIPHTFSHVFYMIAMPVYIILIFPCLIASLYFISYLTIFVSYVVDSGRQKERVQNLSSGVSKFEVSCDSIQSYIYHIKQILNFTHNTDTCVFLSPILLFLSY